MKILIVSHFSVLTMRTGMTLMVEHIAQRLAEEHEVGILTVRDSYYAPRREMLPNGSITRYRGGDVDFDEYDEIIAHPPYNARATISLHDTVKDVGKAGDPRNIKPKLAIFTTDTIRNAFGYEGESIILHPPVFPRQHVTERGSKITLIGMSEHKGVNVLIQLAKRNPEWEFLGVRSGWLKHAQRKPKLPNIEVMEEVKDMREVWSKTFLLIAPSKMEQYGKASLEAMASGIPVIAYDCPGVREALGDAAVYVDTLDPAAWESYIMQTVDEYVDRSDKSYAQSRKIDSTRELNELAKRIKEL